MSILTITDENYLDHIGEGSPGAGLCGTLPRKTAYGSLPFAQPASFDLIPWEEMPDRIADKARNKSSLYDIWEGNGGWVLNQNPLKFCWGFSFVDAFMLERAVQGMPFVRLSPSSVTCPVNNWVNAGGWIENALQYAAENGIASTKFVPEATVDRLAFQRGWREDAQQYKPIGFDDIQPRNPQQVLTSLLLDNPVVVGLNWWEHAVMFGYVVDSNPRLPANRWDRYSIGMLNSWGSDWGQNGWCVLQGNRWLPDQAFRIRQVSATV